MSINYKLMNIWRQISWRLEFGKWRRNERLKLWNCKYV